MAKHYQRIEDRIKVTVDAVCKVCYQKFEKDMPKWYVELMAECPYEWQGFIGTCPDCQI